MAYQYPPPPQNPSYQPQNSNPYGAPGWNAENAAPGSVPQYHSEPAYAEGGIPKSDIGFTNASIRAAFIRKVFFMVSVMLAVVSIMTAIPFLHPPTLQYVKHNPAIYFVSYAAFLVVYIVLMCCEGVRRSFPANIICTGILTLSIGYMTMMISAFYTLESVLMTLIITSLVCGAIIIFSMQTKYDITSMMGWVFIASMVLFFFGIVAIIGTIAFKARILYTIYAGCAALLFMVYLAIDIQMLMGGRKYEISPEDHIFAAIQIFLDIVYIFWMLLSLLGNHN